MFVVSQLSAQLQSILRLVSKFRFFGFLLFIDILISFFVFVTEVRRKELLLSLLFVKKLSGEGLYILQLSFGV